MRMPAALHAASGASDQRGGRKAFTLLELLVAVAVVIVLAGIVMGGVTVMRRRAASYEAAQVVRQLVQALEAYRTEDGRHRYPLHEQLYPTASLTLPHCIARQPEGGAVAGVLGLLVDRNLGVIGSGSTPNGVLTDPWGRPYHYQLTRPAPTAGMQALEKWNWDAALSRPKARNAIDGTSAAPFPYVWSSGPAGATDDATHWIFDGEDH